MTRYVTRRLLLAVPVLLGIMTAVFIMIQLIPGDPAIAMAGDKGSAEQIARIREELGLNRPLPVQYAYFLKAAFTLNFGDSIRTNQPVAGELRQFFGATIELSVAALVDRARRRHPGRRHRRDASRHAARLRHDGRRPHRHQHAGLLGRHRAHLHPQLSPRSLPHRRHHRHRHSSRPHHRRLCPGQRADRQLAGLPLQPAPSPPAGVCALDDPDGHHRPHDALVDARGARPGLPAHRPRQRAGGPAGRHPARVEERPHPDRDRRSVSSSARSSPGRS